MNYHEPAEADYLSKLVSEGELPWMKETKQDRDLLQQSWMEWLERKYRQK